MDNEVVIYARAENDTKRGFDAARREAKSFSSDMGQIGKVAGGSMGDGINTGVFDSIKNLGKSVQPALTPVLAGAAIPGSVIIGATISGAIIAGASVGAAGLGVALVSKRPEIQEAGKQLGNDLMGSLSAKAEVFVGPTLKAIGTIKSSFDSVGGTISNTFENAAKFVDPLVRGVTHFAEGVIRGIDSLVEAGGPVIDVISQGVADLGDSIGDMFHDLEDNGTDAASALQGIFGGLNLTVKAVGGAINGLTEAYGTLVKIGAFGQDAAVKYAVLEANTKLAADAQNNLAGATDTVTEAWNGEKSALEELADERSKSLDPAYALLSAQQDLAEAQTHYNEAIEENGKQSPEAEKALRDLALAAGRAGSAASEAGFSFDGEMTPAMEAMYQNAGLSADQIAGLKNQLRQAASAAHAWEGTFSQTYITRYEEYGLKSPSAMGGFQGLATGGIKGAASGMNTNGLTWVGEQGPELVNIPAGSTVHSSADSQRMMKSGGGGGGGGEFILSAKPGASRGLIEVLVESLQYECRTRYEGLAQNMFGVN